jgi:hypothetical protein
VSLDQTTALQAALAGEHAALYGLGVAGAHLHGARFKAAEELYDRHRRRRDKLTELLTAAGAEPVGAAPAYELPATARTSAGAPALVRLIEQRLAAVYGDLVEVATDTPIRTFAVQSLVAVAHDQTAWGAAPVAFPGASQ